MPNQALLFNRLSEGLAMMEIVHFTQKQLSARWSVSEATLERWRSEGERPALPEAGRPSPLPAGRYRGLRGVVFVVVDQYAGGAENADKGDKPIACTRAGTCNVLTIAIRSCRIRVSNVYARKGEAMRDAAINLRALPEQRDLIDHAASLLGKNRSDFMLEAACHRARAVVLDQVFFSLDADKFRQFTAMLDAPPGPNPGLERLMAVKAPWSTGAA